MLGHEIALIFLAGIASVWAGNLAINAAGHPSSVQAGPRMTVGFIGYLIGVVSIMIAFAAVFGGP